MGATAVIGVNAMSSAGIISGTTPNPLVAMTVPNTSIPISMPVHAGVNALMGRLDAEKYLALHTPARNGVALPSPCLLQAVWPRTLSDVGCMRYRGDLVTGESWGKMP